MQRAKRRHRCPRHISAAPPPAGLSQAAALPYTAASQVLYLGGASGTSVSHVSDLVGPEGAVYAVEFSHRRCVWLREGAWSRQAGLGQLACSGAGHLL